jgi:ferredoxin
LRAVVEVAVREEGDAAVKVFIDPQRCQGHGRCYDLAPEVFGEDDEGYGLVLGGGDIAPPNHARARLAALNCPESAITVEAEGDADERR